MENQENKLSVVLAGIDQDKMASREDRNRKDSEFGIKKNKSRLQRIKRSTMMRLGFFKDVPI